MQDLEFGGILYQRDNISAEEIWEFYKSLPQFEKVVFSQFEARLKVHRKKANESVVRSLREEQYLARDCQLQPRQSHNHRGEPVCDLSPVKLLLQQDIKDKMHVHYKSSKKLQLLRLEYQPFKPRIFHDQIYQEACFQKYIYYLGLKHAKEQGKDPPM